MNCISHSFHQWSGTTGCIFFLALLVFVVNSFAVQLSRDTVFLDNGGQSDTLLVLNNSNQVVTIDTLFESAKIGETMYSSQLEMAFEAHTKTRSSWWGYFGFERYKNNDSIYYLNDVNGDLKNLTLNKQDTIVLTRFLFGHCLRCTDAKNSSASTDSFSITLTFKFSNKQSDRVVFIGPHLISGGTKMPPVVKLKNGKNSNKMISIDLIGRFNRLGTVKNKPAVILKKYYFKGK